MVFGNRLIDIRSFWKPTIRIVKIAIRFSTNKKLCGMIHAVLGTDVQCIVQAHNEVPAGHSFKI